MSIRCTKLGETFGKTIKGFRNGMELSEDETEKTDKEV